MAASQQTFWLVTNFDRPTEVGATRHGCTFQLRGERMEKSIWSRYSFAWVTLILFAVSLVGHWAFGWYEYVDQQQSHGQPIEITQYFVLMGRGTLENWQSEFLQLVWQVVGLTYFLYAGSPQSKEGNDRLEEKVDALLKKLDPGQAEGLIRRLDAKYPGRDSESK
jgi:hypothetical protein